MRWKVTDALVHALSAARPSALLMGKSNRFVPVRHARGRHRVLSQSRQQGASTRSGYRPRKPSVRNGYRSARIQDSCSRSCHLSSHHPLSSPYPVLSAGFPYQVRWSQAIGRAFSDGSWTRVCAAVPGPVKTPIPWCDRASEKDCQRNRSVEVDDWSGGMPNGSNGEPGTQ